MAKKVHRKVQEQEVKKIPVRLPTRKKRIQIDHDAKTHNRNKVAISTQKVKKTEVLKVLIIEMQNVSNKQDKAPLQVTRNEALYSIN